MSKTLTLLLMDPPFESANMTTAFRLISSHLYSSRVFHSVRCFTKSRPGFFGADWATRQLNRLSLRYIQYCLESCTCAVSKPSRHPHETEAGATCGSCLLS